MNEVQAPDIPLFNAFQTADSRGKYLVITNEVSLDRAQITGEWIKSMDPVDLANKL